MRSSHERWDGCGYPGGEAGEAIPLGARVIAVCDAFDAMTSHRSYQRARPKEDAIEELRRCTGTQFDPKVVEVFCTCIARRDESGPPATTASPGEALADTCGRSCLGHA